MENLKLLSKIALSFQNLNDFDKRINEILADIGNFIDVSRIYIFINTSEEIASNIFEWCGQGISPQIASLQKVNHENILYFKNIIKKDGYIRSDDINNLPQKIKNNLQLQKTKSVVIYPLVIENQVKGFIGFDECR